MKTKQVFVLLVCALFLSVLVCGCDWDDDVWPPDDGSDDDGSGTGSANITLNGTAISVDGTGAMVNGSVVTITSAGTYNVKGTLSNGQIAVNTTDAEDVEIVLDGVDIKNSSNPPIYVINAGGKTVIVLKDGSSNSLSDGSTYNLAAGEDEPNAALFSKDDLKIKGNGSLTVTGNYSDGIASKDDLDIKGGKITVKAKDDGIRGKNSIEIKDADIRVNADGDGLKANNDTDTDKGYITIASGTVDITAGADAIQAERIVTIDGGTVDILSGGGSNTRIGRDDTAKGLKAGVSITVNGGTISIDSADDAINSNDNVTITEGTLNLASGDDGIHGDATVKIDGGDVSITKSYEGIESKAITINGGDILVNSSDDGINASNGHEWATSNSFNINGGYTAVYADGDGLDSNGTITMTDGVVIVHGPTANNNGALDTNSTFKISGGTLVAAGSSGMAVGPGTSSSQYSVLANFDTTLAANTTVCFQTSSGSEIATFKPSKKYQSVVISTPVLAKGSYSIYTSGKSTATESDGLYENGSYNPGKKYTDFNISSIVTKIGSGGGPTPHPWP
jgi:hypothetical protein